jgi:hypothetical protein
LSELLQYYGCFPIFDTKTLAEGLQIIHEVTIAIMENDSSLNTTDNNSALFLLPIGAVAFAPFLLLELVAAVVSNAILLALVILACVKKLNNNINIYLFSLAVGGLIGAFDIFCSLSLVVARRWILGTALCFTNFFGMVSYNSIFIIIYLLISRDKLKGVKDPLRGRPTNKKAYVNSAIVWTVVITIATSFVIWGRNNALPGTTNGSKTPRDEYGDFICYGLTNRRVNMSKRFIMISALLISVWTVLFILATAVFSNFVCILLELQKVKKLRLHFAKTPESCERNDIKINGRDKPLYCTGEERTAKSLSRVFFIHFICAVISYVMIFVQVIRNFILSPETEDTSNFQIYFIVQLMVQFFPCINPIFLIMTNKRLRMRVKELFQCTLNPEKESSPTHRLVKKSSSVILAYNTNKIHVAPFSATED